MVLKLRLQKSNFDENLPEVNKNMLTSQTLTHTETQSHRLSGLFDPLCRKIVQVSKTGNILIGKSSRCIIRQNTERVIESLFFMALSDWVNLHSA